MILFDAGRPAAAIAQFETALALDPNLVRAHVNLAVVLAKQGRIDEAIDQFRQALRIDPTNSVARQHLDFLLQQKR